MKKVLVGVLACLTVSALAPFTAYAGQDETGIDPADEIGDYQVYEYQAPENAPVDMSKLPTLNLETRAASLPVRMMALGDDMATGVGSSVSTDSLGFRSVIQRALNTTSVAYEMVGANSRGNAKKYNVKHEGHAAWRIDRFRTDAKKILGKNPAQIIFLYVGMEDVKANYKLAEAKVRYEAMLNEIRNEAQGAQIFVTTLVDTKNTTYQKRVQTLNSEIREIVQRQSVTNGDVTLIELEGLLDTSIDYYNSTLPNDKGYAKVGIAYNKALAKVLPGAQKLATAPIRIMPLGASMTHGWGSSSANENAGYRGYLQKYLNTAKVSYDMVGSLRRGVQNTLDTDNEGHAGYRIDQIAKNTKKWLQDNPADIVLLYIGGNDVSQNYKLVNAQQNLNDLVNLIRESSPEGVKIVVATLFDTIGEVYQTRQTAYNKEVRNVVISQFAANKDVYLADMEGIADIKTDLADRLHANAKGYEKMSAVWNESLKNIIPELR